MKSDEETRRVYTQEFKDNAVRMLMDGHSAGSICERLGNSEVSAHQNHGCVG